MHTHMCIYVHEKIGGTSHQLLERYENDQNVYLAGREMCDVNQ